MSLVCHTIVSRHSPQKDEISEEEITSDEISWRTSATFAPAQRLHTRPAPSFVPASLEYDEFGMPKATRATTTSASAPDLSSWYRSLTSRAREKLPEKAPLSSFPSHRSGSRETQEASSWTKTNATEPSFSKINWFSSMPLQSDNVTSSSSSIPDLLERDPPPLPSEPAFMPPVFLFIGPSNIGFNMLQRKGWEEGEGLGSGRIERKGKRGLGMNKVLKDVFHEHADSKPFSSLSNSRKQRGKQHVIDLTVEDGTNEIVDLTLSDDDDSDIDIQGMDHVNDSIPNSAASEHHGITLLTPIATTLKADKLGIGLKSRRRRAAKDRAITHSPSAIAAHIHASKKNRQLFKKRFGRGSRGFAHAKKKEESDRINLLAYLNS